MRNLKITWKGVTPLLMHSCKCVNPLHPISKELKKYTSKKTKTDEDLEIISNLEWEANAYWKDRIGLYIPAENIEATIRDGAKANKKGTDITKFTQVTDLYVPLNYGENLTKEELIADLQYRDVRAMTIMRNKVLRTRPRFNNWQIEFKLNYFEEKIDISVLLNSMEFAGQHVGLCDSRPRYGKFSAVVEELD